MEGAGGAQGHRPVAGRARAHVPRELARRRERGSRPADGEGEGRRARPPHRAERGRRRHAQARPHCPAREQRGEGSLSRGEDPPTGQRSVRHGQV